jgi:hypothetical protein
MQKKAQRLMVSYTAKPDERQMEPSSVVPPLYEEDLQSILEDLELMVKRG